MIGHSLGPDTTLWTMPFDERIRVAAISGGGLMQWWPPAGPYGPPYADILALIAPRTVFEVTGHNDYTNCSSDAPALSVDERMAAKRAAHASAMEVYALLGAEKRLGRFEFAGGHAFPADGRRASYAWLRQWLFPWPGGGYDLLPPEQPKCRPHATRNTLKGFGRLPGRSSDDSPHRLTLVLHADARDHAGGDIRLWPGARLPGRDAWIGPILASPADPPLRAFAIARVGGALRVATPATAATPGIATGSSPRLYMSADARTAR